MQQTAMLCYPIIKYPGAFYHVIFCGNNKQDIYRDEKYRDDILNDCGYGNAMMSQTLWPIMAFNF